MIFSSIAKFFKSITSEKHAPDVLLGMGIASSTLAIISTIDATSKSVKEIEAIEKVENRKLTRKEKIKVSWKNYIPVAILQGGSIFCLIKADSIHRKQYAMLSAAYGTTTALLKEYKDAVSEEFGTDKEQLISQKVAENEVSKAVQNTNQLYVSEDSKVWFYEPISKTRFKNDLISIYKAVIDLNYDNFTCEFISLNDFYYAIDIPETEYGATHGWNLVDGPIWPDIVPMMDDYGRPMLSIEFTGNNVPVEKKLYS